MDKPFLNLTENEKEVLEAVLKEFREINMKTGFGKINVVIANKRFEDVFMGITKKRKDYK